MACHAQTYAIPCGPYIIQTPQKRSRTETEESAMPIFSLIILIGTSQTPLNVGNFKDLDSCKKAATEMVRGSVTGTATGLAAGPARRQMFRMCAGGHRNGR